jgi:hypothetical protein
MERRFEASSSFVDRGGNLAPAGSPPLAAFRHRMQVQVGHVNGAVLRLAHRDDGGAGLRRFRPAALIEEAGVR